MARPVVILFARAPRLGCVKRRLAAGIGEVPALRFYRNQLGRIMHELAALRGFDAWVAMTPDHAKFRSPCPRLPVVNQGRGDLGVRMARAFRRFAGRRVILVGADIPGLGGGDVRAAARGLRRHEAVFGPAADGGYYLVAMGARRPAKPFATVRWSGRHALADTLANFPGWRIGMLRTLRDVDVAEDLALTGCTGSNYNLK